MNEAQQIATIIKAAKEAPKKIGAFIDDYKEDRFMTKLRAGLDEQKFEIKCMRVNSKTKVIIITRLAGFDPSSN